MGTISGIEPPQTGAPLQRTSRRPDAPLVTRAIDEKRYQQAKFAERIDRLPYFRQIEGPSSTRIVSEGRSRLNLASNNYLGMSTDARVIRASREALERWGTGVTGSRLMNGSLALHRELEEELAGFYGRAASLVFPTGYTANLGLLSGLLRPGDVVAADEEIHASCHDGVRLCGAEMRQFNHNEPAACGDLLRVKEAAMCVVEGVYSMSGDIAPVAEFGSVCEHHRAMFVIDEAHSLGVIGARGRGVIELTEADEAVDAIVVTFSKALGSCGGAVIGSENLIDSLRFAARPFLFTASNTPGSLAGTLAALRLLIEHPEYAADARQCAATFAANLASEGLKPRYGGAAIVMVPTGSDIRTAQAWKMLWNREIFCNASMSPAVPPGTGALRFSFMRNHSATDILRAARTCADVLAEVGLDNLPGDDE